MIVSAPSDYREAARRRLPRFLFDYIDGGAVAENTMNANAAELASVALRQRVLCGAGEPTLATTILDAPMGDARGAGGPVGAHPGCTPRRGEVQAARAASPRRDPRTPYPPCRSASMKRWRATPAARSGPSCTYSKIAAICVTRWSAPGPLA